MVTRIATDAYSGAAICVPTDGEQIRRLNLTAKDRLLEHPV